jgi:hypothetical protein
MTKTTEMSIIEVATVKTIMEGTITVEMTTVEETITVAAKTTIRSHMGMSMSRRVIILRIRLLRRSIGRIGLILLSMIHRSW